MSAVEREKADKERERAIMAYRLMRKQRLQGKKESLWKEEPEKNPRAVSVDRDSASLNTRLFYFTKVKRGDRCMRDPATRGGICCIFSPGTRTFKAKENWMHKIWRIGPSLCESVEQERICSVAAGRRVWRGCRDLNFPRIGWITIRSTL